MKKISLGLSFVLMSVLLLSACSPAAATPHAVYQEDMGMAEAPAAAMPAAPMMAPAPQAESAKAYDSSATSAGGVNNASEVKRIVIKNATLSIVVADPGASMSAIGKMAETMGGFIVNSNIYKTTTRDGIEVPQADISIRVPAERLTEAIELIKAQVSDPATGVTVENVSGSDVTQEYTDLKSRLTNLEKAAEKLTEIMQEARKTEDVMSVYNQLMQVNEQIEVIKGQIKYYDEASSLSQISVTLQSEASVKPITVAGWKPEGVARDAVQTLINTLQGLANVAIWLVIYFLPLLLVLGIFALIAFLIIRAIVRAVRRPQKPQTPPAE